MITVIENFENKVIEIDQFLNFLEMISDPTATLSRSNKRNCRIDSTATKTMKASCFLMLYNLMESTIRESINEIYEHISDENLRHSDLKQEIIDLWIGQCFRNTDPSTSNLTTYQTIAKKIISDILIGEPVQLDIRKLNLKGNIDARKIRRLFKSHKISTSTHYRAFGGGELQTIKDNRNALAHGSISFSQCGQEYSTESLKRIKKQTVVYLRSSLRNVQKYIDRETYAA